MDTIDQLQQGLVEREYATYVGIFVIITVIIAVMSFIIISQNKKINELQRPRFGFLGKPLAVVLSLGLLVGSYGIIFFANRTSTNINEASADIQLSSEISYQNISPGKYLFKVIPKINGRAWGNNPENQFDVYWTFSSKDVNSEVELELSLNKPGGIIVDLNKGVYTIKATIFYDSVKYENEVSVDISE